MAQEVVQRISQNSSILFNGTVLSRFPFCRTVWKADRMVNCGTHIGKQNPIAIFSGQGVFSPLGADQGEIEASPAAQTIIVHIPQILQLVGKNGIGHCPGKGGLAEFLIAFP